MGKTKLGLSFRETGRLTLTTFNKLYSHYKNSFDLEMRLKASNTTYSELQIKSQKAESWF